VSKLIRFFGFVDRTNNLIGKAVSMLIVPMILVLLWEVVSRYLFDRPTLWAYESLRYIWGAHFLLVGGYVLLNKAHVNVDILHMRFPLRFRALVDVLTSAYFYFFYVILLWKGMEMTGDSIIAWELSWTPLHAPLAPLKALVPLGAFLILLQGLVKSIRDIFIAITGRQFEY
jgi:TRAP-type mannitol/chloroaromatic compound transport system permease small subunit